VVTRVFTPIFSRCVEAYPEFSYRRFHLEAALWDMVERRPMHLLSPSFASWDQLLLTAADDVLAELEREHALVQRATWGDRNRARIQHPFAKITTLAGVFLSMPNDPLPGDYDTPRVQAPDDGASERFVVSPGHEAEGIFEMPGGESGHPLSPFFKAGHEAWVKGLPTPFLPGKTEHTLDLTPPLAPLRG
jgi:penicillin amidase